MRRRRLWGAAALICWFVAALLVFVPAHSGDLTCDRPVLDAVAGDPDFRCTWESAKRLGGLVEWLVITAPVTVMFVVQPREPRD